MAERDKKMFVRPIEIDMPELSITQQAIVWTKHLSSLMLKDFKKRQATKKAQQRLKIISNFTSAA